MGILNLCVIMADDCKRCQTMGDNERRKRLKLSEIVVSICIYYTINMTINNMNLKGWLIITDSRRENTK